MLCLHLPYLTNAYISYFFSFIVDSWSSCSASCGEGMRFRRVLIPHIKYNSNPYKSMFQTFRGYSLLIFKGIMDYAQWNSNLEFAQWIQIHA